jgi:hypothetical protein
VSRIVKPSFLESYGSNSEDGTFGKTAVVSSAKGKDLIHNYLRGRKAFEDLMKGSTEGFDHALHAITLSRLAGLVGSFPEASPV